MKVQTNKTNNVAEDLIGQNVTVAITRTFTDSMGNTVAEGTEAQNGSLMYCDGVITLMSPFYEVEVHENVTEVKEVGGTSGEYLKGTTIKLEDYEPMKYTYDGSAWGTV